MKKTFSKFLKTGMCLLSVTLLLPNMLACKTGVLGNGGGIGGGRQPADAERKGAFLEREVTPEGLGLVLGAPVLLEDGSIVLYGQKNEDEWNEYRFTSRDEGITWTEEELSWYKETGADTIWSEAPLYDGSCFFVAYQMAEDESRQSESWWLQRADGLVEIPRPDWAEDTFLDRCKMMTPEILYMTGSNYQKGESYHKIYNINTKEAVDVKFTFSNSSGISETALNHTDPANPELYFIDYGARTALMAMNIKGEVREVVNDLNGEVSGTTLDAEGNYYYIEGGNIIRIAKGGSVKEMIIENNNFLIGLPNYYCSGMTYVSDTCFIANLVDFNNNTSMIVRYYYDENASLSKTDKLTIWTLYENDTLRLASRAYGNDHPETEIHIIVGVDEATSTEEEDAIRSLKASLITDECPDLILLDGLDYMNMAKKGYFIDLSQSVNTEELLSNIISPLYQNGELPVVPARFSALVLIGDDFNEHPIRNLSDLKEVILSRPARVHLEADSEEYYTKVSAEERYGMGFKDMKELVHFTLMTSASEIIVNDGLNDRALEEAFDFILSVGNHYGMKNYPANGFSNCASASWGDGTDIMEFDTGEIEYSMCGRAQYGWGELKSPVYFGECRRDRSLKDTKGTLISFPGLSEKPYIPKCVMGVPVNAKNQTQAVEMLNVMLSKNIQLTQDMSGNAINKEALAERIKAHEELIENGGFEGDVDAFYSGLKTPVILGTQANKLEELMIAEANDVIAGKKTKEQAIANIKDGTHLMFEEQK